MLKIFNATTDFDRRQKPAVLNIHPDGRFFFSVEAVKFLGLKEGDRLSFAYDEDDRGVVYFFKSKDGLILHKIDTIKGSTRLWFASRSLSRKLLGFLQINRVKSFRLNRKTVRINNQDSWFITKR